MPRSAFDPGEIMFSGDAPGGDNSEAARSARIAGQQAMFESFIQSTPCLRRQRGNLLERNSCREPWTHTTIASVRQAIPIAGQGIEAELDVFNVLNLLNGRWGRYRVVDPFVLEHVAHTPEPLETAQPIFRVDATRLRRTTLKTESAFQLQLALRYRF